MILIPFNKSRQPFTTKSNPSVSGGLFALTRGAFLGMVGTMLINWPPETMNEHSVQ